MRVIVATQLGCPTTFPSMGFRRGSRVTLRKTRLITLQKAFTALHSAQLNLPSNGAQYYSSVEGILTVYLGQVSKNKITTADHGFFLDYMQRIWLAGTPRRVPNKCTHRAQRARRCACYFLHFPSVSWVHMEYIAVYMVFFRVISSL